MAPHRELLRQAREHIKALDNAIENLSSASTLADSAADTRRMNYLEDRYGVSLRLVLDTLMASHPVKSHNKAPVDKLDI